MEYMVQPNMHCPCRVLQTTSVSVENRRGSHIIRMADKQERRGGPHSFIDLEDAGAEGMTAEQLPYLLIKECLKRVVP
ncbi:hypothetical protein GCM10009771_16980 [Nesterenkonia flava]